MAGSTSRTIMQSVVYTVEDVMAMMDYKRSAASKLIQTLNNELKAQGYETREGRVSQKYFDERFNVDSLSARKRTNSRSLKK